MRTFNYSEIKKQKWDSDVLSLIAAIYKEAGKQEMYLKQRPEELEKLVDLIYQSNEICFAGNLRLLKYKAPRHQTQLRELLQQALVSSRL